MTELQVRSEEHGYSVLVGHGIVRQLGQRLTALGMSGRVAVVTDDTVARYWREPVLSSLIAERFVPEVFTLRPGEANTSLSAAEPLYGALIRAGFSRADPLIALGGGVVGDLAGFVAATYHRGMPLVQVPTTLLAQVDASIGGKVAVDHPLGKNLVGAFHPPRFVLVDVTMLGTLPSRERWTGLAEMVKHGLIADAGLLADLDHHLEALGAGELDVETLESLVARSIRVKTEVVSVDEREQGVRLHLNFGHTLGHALETVTGYGPLTHGEAIVIGMRAAVKISERLGRLDAASAAGALRLLARFPAPPARIPPPTREALLAAMSRDKKAVAGNVRFIVLDGLGRAAVVPSLPPDVIEAGINWVLAEL